MEQKKNNCHDIHNFPIVEKVFNLNKQTNKQTKKNPNKKNLSIKKEKKKPSLCHKTKHAEWRPTKR